MLSITLSGSVTLHCRLMSIIKLGISARFSLVYTNSNIQCRNETGGDALASYREVIGSVETIDLTFTGENRFVVLCRGLFDALNTQVWSHFISRMYWKPWFGSDVCVVVYTAGRSGDCLHRVYYTVFEEEAAGCEGKDGERYIAVCIIDCLLEIYDWWFRVVILFRMIDCRVGEYDLREFLIFLEKMITYMSEWLIFI